MRSLILVAALGLTGCTAATAGTSTLPPTTLPSSVLVDDKAGVAVETAYQAVSLAERTAIAAGYISPARARQLIPLDNQAYQAVCYTRTAYDVANGRDPSMRSDACPVSTKVNRGVAYADAARSAVETIRALLGAVATSSSVK